MASIKEKNQFYNCIEPALSEVPLPLQHCLLSLPELQEHGGPEGHEYRKEYRAVVVKEVGELGDQAGVLELPKGAVGVTDRAHGQVSGQLLGADTLTTRKNSQTQTAMLCIKEGK